MAKNFEPEKTIAITFPLMDSKGCTVNEGDLASAYIRAFLISGSQDKRVDTVKSLTTKEGVLMHIQVAQFSVNVSRSEEMDIKRLERDFFESNGWTWTPGN